MLDDGIWYDPQTETGHPGFTGQISKDSRNIDKLYINPGPDSLKIDENTNHWSLAWALIDRTMGPFVPKDENDKYVVYKVWGLWGVAPYDMSLALDRIVLEKQQHLDMQYIVSDAWGGFARPDDPGRVFFREAYKRARDAGVIILHAIGNEDQKVDIEMNPELPFARNPESAVMGHQFQQVLYPDKFSVPSGTNYSDKTILAFKNSLPYPRLKNGEYDYSYGGGTSMSSAPMAIVFALTSRFHDVQGFKNITDVMRKYSRMGIYKVKGIGPDATVERENPNVINPSILNIVEAGIFPEIPEMDAQNGRQEINYKKPNNDRGLESYLDPSTPWYVQKDGVDGIDPSTLASGTYTAILIVQVPGKDTDENGNTTECIMDHEIKRKFVVKNTSAVENVKGNEVYIYPTIINKEGILNISPLLSTSVKVRIYNIDGELVAEKNCSSNDKKIHLSHYSLSSGVYIVHLIAKNRTQTTKIIIQ